MKLNPRVAAAVRAAKFILEVPSNRDLYQAFTSATNKDYLSIIGQGTLFARLSRAAWHVQPLPKPGQWFMVFLANLDSDQQARFHHICESLPVPPLDPGEWVTFYETLRVTLKPLPKVSLKSDPLSERREGVLLRRK
jgi:hypothetical protein